MGNTASQSIGNYLTNNATYTQIISSHLDAHNKTGVNVVNTNNKSVSVGKGGKLDCENLQAGQKVTNNETIAQSINSNLAQQMSAQLRNTAQADVKNALDQMQKNDPISGFANKTKQEVMTMVTNNINNTLKTENFLKLVNETLSSTVNENKMTLEVLGEITGKTCDFTQGIANTIAVTNVLSSVGKQFSEGDAANKFFDATSGKLSQEQTGVVGTVTGAISDFFAKIGQLGLILIIGGALFVFLVIAIITALIFFRGGGKEALQTVAQNPQLLRRY
jgi:hypothetical protein